MNNSMTNEVGVKSNIATLNVAYKIPGRDEVQGQSFKAPLNYSELHEADSTLRFASAVIMFGSLLKQSKFAKDIKFDDIQGLAVTAASSNNLLQMQFIELVQKAKKIYSFKKRKKGME